MGAVFWSVLLVLFLIIEGATVSLTTIWFAVGAAGGIIASLLNVPVFLQWLIFIVISAALLFLVRPAAKKIMPSKIEPTNADLNIGRSAQVIQRIDNISSSGRVRLDGVDWAALSEDGSVIESGESVTVTAVNSAKLIVKKK